MRLLLAASAALLAAAASPARADAPPDRGFARRPVPSRLEAAPALRRRAPDMRDVRIDRPRRHDGTGPGFIPRGPRYGAEPPYFPGMGGASPNAGFGAFGPVPVAVTEYREAYIGRGLIYNVPPQPDFASSNVISVRY